MAKYKLNVGRKEIVLKADDGLIDIDRYTVKFNNDTQLRIDLYNKGIISLKDNYAITLSSDAYRGNIPVLYKEHLNYINPNNLRLTYVTLQNYFYSNFDDREFLDKLIAFCGCLQYPTRGIMELMNVRDGFECSPNEKNEIVEDVCSSIMNFPKTKVYNYKNIRQFGLFIYRYEKIKDLEVIKQKIEEPSDDYHLLSSDEYEGEQLSFFKKN